MSGLDQALFTLAVAAHGGGEHGGGEHASGIDWVLVVSLFTNAILFFGFLFWAARPAVSKALAARRANMAVDLERAQAKQTEAEQRLAEYQAKLDNLEREVAVVVQAYEREAKADEARIREETDRAIERMNREAEFTIRQETVKARRAIQAAAVEATLDAAEKKIRERIGDADHARLTRRYVDSLNATIEGSNQA